jgi:hypothetical protein
LKQAQLNTNAKSEAVFEIYSNLQKFDSSVNIETIRYVVARFYLRAANVTQKLRQFFSQDFVLIPSTPLDNLLQWTKISACLWSASEWFKMKIGLSAFSEYESLSNLFTVVLGAGTAGLFEFLAYLLTIKRKGVIRISAENQSNIVTKQMRDQGMPQCIVLKVRGSCTEF